MKKTILSTIILLSGIVTGFAQSTQTMQRTDSHTYTVLKDGNTAAHMADVVTPVETKNLKRRAHKKIPLPDMVRSHEKKSNKKKEAHVPDAKTTTTAQPMIKLER